MFSNYMYIYLRLFKIFKPVRSHFETTDHQVTDDSFKFDKIYFKLGEWK